jgi:hypothetical protein
MKTINITDLDNKAVKFVKFLPDNFELYLGKLKFTICVKVNASKIEWDGTFSISENELFKGGEDATFVVTSDVDTIGFKVVDTALLSECEFTYNTIDKTFSYVNGYDSYTLDYITSKINTLA